nr:nodulin MtN21 /EamA-like transporter family protein [Tanacetum cinerariifolium]
MVEQQTIKYAPQWNNMTVDNVMFQTNNVVELPYGVLEHDVSYDHFPSTDESEKCPLKEFLIKFLVLNGQRPLTLNFNTFCLSTGLNYNNGNYVDHPTPEIMKKELGKIAINPNKKFGFLPPILSNSNFTKDPSKVTDIKLTAHMIVVNNQRDSVSLPPLGAKPKKGKSQTVTSTLPKSQGLEASGALSKKSKRPKSKKSPTETMVIVPKPMEGSEQSHLVSSGTIPDPQDLKRDIQLASIGLPSTLDEGTRTAKTMSCPEGSRGDKDSKGHKAPADMEPQNPTDANLSRTGSKYQEDQTQSSRLRKSEEDILGAGEEMDDNPRSTETQHRKVSRVLFERITEDQWEKHEEAVVHYVNLKASIDDYYNESIAHKDQTDKLVEASMSSLEKSSTTINDLYKGMEVITQLLKDITNYVKDNPVTNKKIEEAFKTLSKISTQTTEILSSVKSFDFSTLQSTVKNIQDRAFKQEEALVPWMKSSTNMAWNLEEEIKKAEEEARLNAISKTGVIKVVREEAKKLSIHPKEAITTKAGNCLRKLRMLNMRSSKDNTLRRIQSVLPAPEQAPSQTLRKQRKHMELEPETRIPGLKCNRALFKMSSYQRWSDIDKVRMKALVSYLVVASMVKSPEIARFGIKLRKLIAEHPGQEKLKSKKVKLEALGYNMD